MSSPARIKGTDAAGTSEILNPDYASRGFLPIQDPLTEFPRGSPYAMLDRVGRALPESLRSGRFRDRCKKLEIPPWNEDFRADRLPEMRLYYLRIAFLASAYINQTGAAPCDRLPANIAVPLVGICKRLNRPPVLSYDGYALYNWRRIEPQGPVALGNLATLQNFVDLRDESWFILVHVEIEAIAARILRAIASLYRTPGRDADTDPAIQLQQIADAVDAQKQVLQRIPEGMDPQIYFHTFRPYIRFFENVVYEGLRGPAMHFRGETGAQSSIMPTLEALMKIPHRTSMLTRHLNDMQNYMPAPHRRLIGAISELPELRNPAHKDAFNAILNAMAGFRKVHLRWAEQYIHQHVSDPRGTGGTPFMPWLQQLIDETLAHRIDDGR